MIIDHADMVDSFKREVRKHDAYVEKAFIACYKLAELLGETGQAVEAWRACQIIKGLRRVEIVDRLDADRLARVRAA